MRRRSGARRASWRCRSFSFCAVRSRRGYRFQISRRGELRLLDEIEFYADDARAFEGRERFGKDQKLSALRLFAVETDHADVGFSAAAARFDRHHAMRLP